MISWWIRRYILMWPEMTLSICTYLQGVTLLLRITYWDHDVEIYCSWCITILRYTFQSRKFEKFINIHSLVTGKYFCWRLFLMKLQACNVNKRDSKKGVSSEYWEIFKSSYFEHHLQTAASVFCNIFVRTLSILAMRMLHLAS